MANERTALFIAGTAAGVGKTTVAAALVPRLRALGRDALAMKPVETGCAHGDDQDLVGHDGLVLHRAAHRAAPPLVISPYRFPSRGAPALAAERAGLELSLEDLAAAVETAFSFGELLIVEGPHGALSPLTKDALALDLAEKIGAAVLVVAEDRASAESAVIAVIESLRRRALKIAGVILVRTSRAPAPELDALENARLIRERGGVTVFPTVPFSEGDETGRLVAVEAHLAEHAIAEALLRALDGP